MPRIVKTRKRVLPPLIVASGRVVNEDYSGFNPVTVNDFGTFSIQGTQITESEGHAWPLDKSKPFSDQGGDFFTQKKYISGRQALPYAKIIYLQSSIPLIRNTYEGHLFPIIPGFAGYPGGLPFPPSQEYSTAQMNQAGATAISRCKPGDPYHDFSTAIGETVKDGLPAIPGVALLEGKVKSLLGKGGDEYLNFQFGLQPFLNDLDKLRKAVTRSSAILKQFERDAGRHVRRRYRFPIESSTQTDTVLTNVYPGWVNWMDARSPVKQALLGKVVRTRDTFRRVWFSGSFTYTLPPDWNSANGVASVHEKFNHLFGLNLTPEILWNLAPWSWAIDWFSSTGDVLSNASSFLSNGLVMHYGYIMVHTITTDTYSHVPNSTSSLVLPNVPEVSFVTETKQRKEANPFGFGVSWDGLTPYQVSIAAALGITRK